MAFASFSLSSSLFFCLFTKNPVCLLSYLHTCLFTTVYLFTSAVSSSYPPPHTSVYHLFIIISCLLESCLLIIVPPHLFAYHRIVYHFISVYSSPVSSSFPYTHASLSSPVYHNFCLLVFCLLTIIPCHTCLFTVLLFIIVYLRLRVLFGYPTFSHLSVYHLLFIIVFVYYSPVYLSYSLFVYHLFIIISVNSHP